MAVEEENIEIVKLLNNHPNIEIKALLISLNFLTQFQNIFMSNIYHFKYFNAI